MQCKWSSSRDHEADSASELSLHLPEHEKITEEGCILHSHTFVQVCELVAVEVVENRLFQTMQLAHSSLTVKCWSSGPFFSIIEG